MNSSSYKFIFLNLRMCVYYKLVFYLFIKIGCVKGFKSIK